MEALPQGPLPHRPLPSPSYAERIRDWIEWFGLARLAVVAVSVLAVGAGGYWLLDPPPDPVEASLPMTPGAGGATTPVTSTAPTDATAAPVPPAAEAPDGPAVIVVHVAGAVALPGVYRLAPDSRVIDAVAAAGGAAVDAAADAVNLAAPLRDGDRVYLPRLGEAPPVPAGVTSSAGAGPPSSGAPAGPVDLNTATAEQLDTLPGVGPSTAQAIVDHRNTNGPFASVDGLTDVRGIGPAKLESLRALVTV